MTRHAWFNNDPDGGRRCEVPIGGGERCMLLPEEHEPESWVLVEVYGGLLSNWTTSDPGIQVMSVDWDSVKEDFGSVEYLLEELPHWPSEPQRNVLEHLLRYLKNVPYAWMDYTDREILAETEADVQRRLRALEPKPNNPLMDAWDLAFANAIVAAEQP